MIFKEAKAKKQEMNDAVEGVKAAGKAVGKVRILKDKIFNWMTDNPEKVILIGLAAVCTAVISGEVRRSKTEVNVTINIPDIRMKK